PVSTDDVGRAQDRAVAAPLADGRWVVAWQETTAGDSDIYFRFLSAEGDGLGPVLCAYDPLTPKSVQDQPAVLVGEDDLLMRWKEDREGTSDVWGRWFSLDGVAQGSEERLREAQDPAEDLHPRLVPGQAGAYALLWFGGIDDRQRAMARFFDATRHPFTPSLP